MCTGLGYTCNMVMFYAKRSKDGCPTHRWTGIVEVDRTVHHIDPDRTTFQFPNSENYLNKYL